MLPPLLRGAVTLRLAADSVAHSDLPSLQPLKRCGPVITAVSTAVQQGTLVVEQEGFVFRGQTTVQWFLVGRRLVDV